MNDSMNDAATVLRRCDELATFSEEEGRLTRRFGTPALREAADRLREWMEAAGLQTRRDAVGNVIGRLGADGERTLLIGSHFDTVRDAGRYDGPLGLLVAIACLERLRDEGRPLPYAVEVIAFADEEGVRYGTGYLGSSVVAGSFQDITLGRRDADGVTLADAIRSVGGDPEGLAGARRDPNGVIGYYEVHIEQGPVLEDAGVPLGVVDAIAGQSRAHVTFTGRAGHAGTVPMALRRDALCAAAEFIGAVEALARAQDGVAATVGEIEVQPGTSNVIPGQVALSLDIRHATDSVRESLVTDLLERASTIADQRGCGHGWELQQDTKAVACSEELTGLVAEAVQAAGQPVLRLTSGAGHDAVTLSRIAPVAMLFVRCAGGISHSPAESVTVEDVAAAIEATTRFLGLVA
jgi:allantoate deiminase